MVQKSRKKYNKKNYLHTARIYSQDIGMKFGIEKSSPASNGKQQTTPYRPNGTTKSRQN